MNEHTAICFQTQLFNPVDVKLFKDISAIQERPEGRETDEDADDEEEEETDDEAKVRNAPKFSDKHIWANTSASF